MEGHACLLDDSRESGAGKSPGPTDGQVGYVCSCMPWRTAILRDTHIMHLDLQQSVLQGRRGKNMSSGQS